MSAPSGAGSDPGTSLSQYIEMAEKSEEGAAEALNAGSVAPLAELAEADSTTPAEQQQIGRLAMAIVKYKELRPNFVQEGGFKALCNSLAKLTPLGEAALPGCHAYARLLMTTPPAKLFFKGHALSSSAGLDPLYFLLLTPLSTKQQQYESLMALANMATISPVIGSRIVNGSIDIGGDTKRVVPRVEELLRSPDKLQTRAASQLVCNLVSSRAGWYYWSGETQHFDFPGEPSGSKSDTSKETDSSNQLDPQVGARLGVLLLLTNSDDPATRRSAAATLAVVTQSERACSALLQLKIVTPAGAADASTQLWICLVSMFTQTEDPDLKTRAAIIGKNILTYINRFYEPAKSQEITKARASGLTEQLQSEMMQVSQADMIKTLQAACKVL